MTGGGDVPDVLRAERGLLAASVKQIYFCTKILKQFADKTKFSRENVRKIAETTENVRKICENPGKCAENVRKSRKISSERNKQLHCVT